MKPARGTIKRRPPARTPLAGELRATPIEDSLASLYVLAYVAPDGASRFVALLEGSRELVTVAVLRLALKMRLQYDSGRRARPSLKRLPRIVRPARGRPR